MTPATLLDWLRLHGHAPESRGEQVFVPRWPYVPEDKRALVREHRDALRSLLAAVPATKQEEQQETATAVGEPTPLSPPAAVAPQPEPPRPKAAFNLPREKWDAAGIEVVNGIPTHSRGDQHAAQIIAGHISYEEAVKARAASLNMLAEMAHSQRRR